MAKVLKDACSYINRTFYQDQICGDFYQTNICAVVGGNMHDEKCNISIAIVSNDTCNQGSGVLARNQYTIDPKIIDPEVCEGAVGGAWVNGRCTLHGQPSTELLAEAKPKLWLVDSMSD